MNANAADANMVSGPCKLLLLLIVVVLLGAAGWLIFVDLAAADERAVSEQALEYAAQATGYDRSDL